MTDDPEERAWFVIGKRLGIPVEVLKGTLPTSEYLGWIHTFNEEWYEPDLVCHHLAQIAHQIYLLRCSLPFVGQKPKATYQDFLHLFKRPKKKKDESRRLLEKPLQRTASGKVIDPEWQKKIDTREAALRTMLGLGAKQGTDPVHYSQAAPGRRKPPRKPPKEPTDE